MEHVLEKLRDDAKRIWEAALSASDAEEAVRRHVRLENGRIRCGESVCHLPAGRQIHVFGCGKASAAMARAAEQVLGERIAGGLVVVKYGHGKELERIEVAEGAHPTPDRNGVLATARLLASVDRIPREDLLLVLISGGGSALLEAPAEGLSLEDLIACSSLLLGCGASIHEMNAVRKHLSAVKGGLLARRADGRETWTLLLSDVPGDTLDAIASGPTVPDSTTFADALQVLERYELQSQMPSAVMRHLREGGQGRRPETPKATDPCFGSQHPLIVGSNALACRAALQMAVELGYAAELRLEVVTGDNREFAREICGTALELQPVSRPVCRISGGETTVRLRGRGKGGRNQDQVLNCVEPLARFPAPTLFASIGTDGTDGPTDAAGALADNQTLERHAALSNRPLQSFLDEFDSYHFFDPLGDLIRTGPTGTNVMDIHLLLAAPREP